MWTSSLMSLLINLLLMILLIIHSSQSYQPWKSMSSIHQVSTFICEQHVLTPQQKQICLSWFQSDPNSIDMVQRGVNISIHECQHQFKNERWNCPAFRHDTDDGGELIETKPGSRESAFVHAITSAAIAYRVTAACSDEDLQHCTCDPKKRGGSSTDEQGKFEWNGCSDNINYGVDFAQRYLDSLETSKNDAINRVNLHNNLIGRKAVKKFFKRKCRCHGPTSTCPTRTCFQILENFRMTGNYLKEKYDRALKVRVLENGTIKLNRRRSMKTLKGRNHLYYLERSADYCKRDVAKGSLGTGGRLCNATSKGRDSCDHLCCGRGYDEKRETSTIPCRCKFVWCCNMTCSTCDVSYNMYTCKEDPDENRTFVAKSSPPLVARKRNRSRKFNRRRKSWKNSGRKRTRNVTSSPPSVTSG